MTPRERRSSEPSAERERAAPWFHSRLLPAPGEAGQLSREEARHASGSRRLVDGDAIVLFDGRGGIAHARIRLGARPCGALAIEVERIGSEPPPSPWVTIATAIPKGDHFRTLLDMIAQLGANAIVPLDCERSVVRGSSVRRDRAERILVEACKQSRQAWMPELRAPTTPRELAAGASGDPVTRVWAAHPGGGRMLDLPDGPVTGAITIAIGPEGGFTEGELDAFRSAAVPLVSLGRSVLRVETACVAALSLIRA